MVADIEFSFIKVGDEQWESRSLDVGLETFWNSNFHPVYLNGVYYYLDCKYGNIMTFDLTKEEYKLIRCEKCPEEVKDEEDVENKDEEGEYNNEREDEEEKKGEDDEDEEDENKHGVEYENGKGGVDNEDENGHWDEQEQEPQLEESGPTISHESYMIEVDEDIWDVFITGHKRRVSIQKLNLSKNRWIKLESLGDKCFYVSKNGSFAETCIVNGMTNKIYFSKFYGKSGVIYFLTSGMYHSVDGDFTSKKAYGLTEMKFGVWIKPIIDQV